MSNQRNKPKATKKKAKASPSGDDFLSTAKRLECDEDRARFEEKLGKLAKAKTKAGEKG